MAAPPERLWTETELAERWNMSPRTLRNWRYLGTGPKAIKVGRSALYPESGIIRWEKAQPRRLARGKCRLTCADSPKLHDSPSDEYQ